MRCGDWEVDAKIAMEFGDAFIQDALTRPLRHMRLLQIFPKDPRQEGGMSVMPLHPVLLMGKTMRATLARDHLFALSNISIWAPVLPHFSPDYDEPLESIVFRFGRGLLEQVGVGPLLYGAGIGQNPDRFPTWIPDWMSPANLYSDADPLAHVKTSAAGDVDEEVLLGADIPPAALFLAGMGLDPSSIPSLDLPELPDEVANAFKKLLFVKGGVVYEIQLVGECVGNAYQDVAVGFRDSLDGLEIEALAAFFESAGRIRGVSSTYPPTGESFDDVFARTIICDQDLSLFMTAMVPIPMRGVPVPISTVRQCYQSLRLSVDQRAGFIDRALDAVHEAGCSLEKLAANWEGKPDGDSVTEISKSSGQYERKAVACICDLIKYNGWSQTWENTIDEVHWLYKDENEKDEDEDDEGVDEEEEEEEEDGEGEEEVQEKDNNQSISSPGDVENKTKLSDYKKIFDNLRSLDVTEEVPEVLDLVFTKGMISRLPNLLLQQLGEFVKTCIIYSIWEHIKLEHAADSFSVHPGVSNKRWYTQVVRNATQGRKLCLSVRGYIGLVPETAKAGDRICLLYGAKTPFIIRERSSSQPFDQLPLRQLYPDTHLGDDAAPSAPAKVDIFAVHGLNPRSKKDADHAWDTWRTPAGPRGRLWLRDDLPQHIPSSRIFLYQYNSTAVYGRDRTTFVDKANDLLEAIRAEREEDDDDDMEGEVTEPRPILFLGHSLGGLLIKQALVNAHNNPKYAPIKSATRGIAFFATPHNGGNRMLVGIGGIAARIATDLGFQKGDNIIEMLRDGSLFSDMMQELWRQQLLTYNIVTFWGALDGIVPRESARLNLPGDRENVVTLAADHRSICKFGETETDQDNFKLVRTNLKDLYKSAIRPRDGSTILNSVPQWLFDRSVGDASKSEADYQHCPADHGINAEFLRGFTNTNPFLAWADRARSSIWCQLGPDAPAAHQTIAACIMRHASSSNINLRSGQCSGRQAVKVLYYKCSTTQTAPVPKIYAEGLEDPEIESNFRESSDEDDSQFFAPELMLRSFIAQTTTNESALLQEYKRVAAANPGQKASRTLLQVFMSLVRRYKGRVVLVVDDLHHVQSRITELLETLADLAKDGDNSPSNCSVLLGGDPGSAGLSDALRGIPAVGPTSEYQECCSSLLVESGHTRRDEILAPVQGTNQWIWDHPRFTSWAGDARGALAIVGKPGSGKSVLAKHIMAMLLARVGGQHESALGSHGNVLLSAWFYSERSGEQFIRHQSLLRSFLHEFLTRDAQLFDLCKPVYRKAPPAPLRTWTTDEMQTLLKVLAGSGRSFLMVIDAVDEATDDSILRLVEDMSQIPGSRMKFIVLTRPVRLLDRKFWDSRNITLQSENEKDIRKVVFQRCAALRRRMHDTDSMDLDNDSTESDADADWDDEAPALHSTATTLETLELQKLCDTIIERADGVMLWVILVFDSLSRMLAREGFLLLSEIRERAMQMPTGLNDFYSRFVQDLQTRLDENGLLKVRRVLMWISAASEVRPFTLGELYDALAIPHDQDATQVQDLHNSPFSPLERNRIPASSWAGRRRILQNLCGPFIDIIRVTNSEGGEASETTADSASTIVQLVHQTAKDFLTQSADAGSLRFGAKEATSMVRTSAIRYVKLMLPRARCAYAPVPFETRTGWEDNMDVVLSYFEQLRLIPFCAVLATRDALVLSEIQGVAELAILHGFLIFPAPQIPHEIMGTQSDNFVSTAVAKFFRKATLRGMVGAARVMLSLSRLVSDWWNTDGHTVRYTTLFIVFERVTSHLSKTSDHEYGLPWQALADTPVRQVVSEVVKWRVDGSESGEQDHLNIAINPTNLSEKRPPPRLQVHAHDSDGVVTAVAELLCYVWPLATVKIQASKTLPLRDFIYATLRRARISVSVVQVALYYIAVLKINTLDRIEVEEELSDLYILHVDLQIVQDPRRVFLAALVVALKYLQDRNYSMRAWSKISVKYPHANMLF
ncbi:hypothetical protein OQA88_10804 [Cercophora sp. LCS_1]